LWNSEGTLIFFLFHRLWRDCGSLLCELYMWRA
jgi:hypothetical protein